MERTILVKSSSGEDSYSVEVSSTEEHGITIMCDCAAGEWGKYCKHKMGVALGDATILFDDEQIDSFKEISNWIASSNYPNLFSEIRVVEKELEVAKKNVKSMKEQIARFMRDGLKSILF
jgi:hypothetical protein|tara:strand:+ start:122 stop:481 length:360 start_codon:yes stop_codon:yes gene_type:complete